MTRKLVVLPLILFLFPMVTLGETMDDLVEREGIYYKQFTNVPFTGNITGTKQGKIKNGKKEGPWVEYSPDGSVLE